MMTSVRSFFPHAGRPAWGAFVALSPLAARLQIAIEEFANQLRDLVAMRLQGEVAGIEEMYLCMWNVELVRRGTGCHEDGVVLALHDQRRGLVFTEIGLPLGIQRDVRAVVVE
jgi:hypothetical protein